MKQNPDFENPLNEGLEICKGCGMKIKDHFGHDEYLYLVLKNNKIIDKKWILLDFILLHTGKAYQEFTTEADKNLDEVLDFNQFDLYSKEI